MSDTIFCERQFRLKGYRLIDGYDDLSCQICGRKIERNSHAVIVEEMADRYFVKERMNWCERCFERQKEKTKFS